MFLTGSHDEDLLCEQAKKDVQRGAHNLAGQTNLSQLAGLFSLADLVIANDTGALHLADAAGAKRTIGIFGPTSPVLAAPLSETCTVIKSAIACSPCMLLDASDPTRACHNPNRYTCLLDLPVDDVWSVVKQVCDALIADQSTREAQRDSVMAPQPNLA